VAVSVAEAKVTRRFTGFCGLQEAVTVNDFQDFREHLSEVVVSLQILPVITDKTAFTELKLSLTNSHLY